MKELMKKQTGRCEICHDNFTYSMYYLIRDGSLQGIPKCCPPCSKIDEELKGRDEYLADHPYLCADYPTFDEISEFNYLKKVSNYLF